MDCTWFMLPPLRLCPSAVPTPQILPFTSRTKQRIDPRPVQGCPALSVSVSLCASSLLLRMPVSAHAPDVLSAGLASAMQVQDNRLLTEQACGKGSDVWCYVSLMSVLGHTVA